MNPPLEVAEQIYLVELPLPFALNSVNCYLLRDGDGWAVVDTGLNTPQARAVWQETFTALDIQPQAIGRIILTHSHPDHYGLAGWFQNLCSRQGNAAPVPPVLMSAREADLAALVWQSREDWFEQMRFFFAHCGLTEDLIGAAISGVQEVRGGTRPHPHVIERLEAGMTLQIGPRNFEVMQAQGHSDGQLIFYDAADQLMLCGDQVLLNITPNISVWPFTDADPLGRYLTSLHNLARLEVRLALPGHRSPISGWSERLAEIEAHHARRLDRMLAAVDTDATSFEISRRVFNFDKLTAHEIRFAVTETLAHLEYLVGQNQLRRNDNGVWRYERG